MAGALAGAFARTATAPVERVKLILQVRGQGSSNAAASLSSSPSSSSWDVCRQIYREEGVMAFWRGNSQNVLRAAGQAALNFALMDYYKGMATATAAGEGWWWWGGWAAAHDQQQQQQQQQRQQSRRRPPSWMVSLVAGGLAGGTATTILYPTDFLRTRLALDLGRTTAPAGGGRTTGSSNTGTTRQYRGMWDVFRQIVRSDGIRGVYNGFGVSLVGGVLYRLLYLGGYDAAKDELLASKQRRQRLRLRRREKTIPPTTTTTTTPSLDMSWTERFLLAQAVSLSAGTACYPIDSVRRRMMMQAGKRPEDRLYGTSSVQCFRLVWANEGLRGFYLGFGPNVIRSIGGALALVAYDALKAALNTVN